MAYHAKLDELPKPTLIVTPSAWIPVEKVAYLELHRGEKGEDWTLTAVIDGAGDVLTLHKGTRLECESIADRIYPKSLSQDITLL